MVVESGRERGRADYKIENSKRKRKKESTEALVRVCLTSAISCVCFRSGQKTTDLTSQNPTVGEACAV